MKALVCICLLAMFLVLGCVQTPAESLDTKVVIQTTNKTSIQDTNETVSDATVGKAITKFDLVEDVSEVETEETTLDYNETNELARKLPVINRTIITQVPSPTRCVDSDGNNASRRGTTSIMSGTRLVETRTDYCNGNRVVEYVCRNSSMISGLLTCRDGCSDGRCNPEPAVTSTTDSVVVFDSPGQRRLLIINDLNPTTETLAGITVTINNTIASIRIGQTQSLLDYSSTEVLETMDFACVESGSFAMVDTIDADGSKRVVDPSTLSTSGSDNSYRYFTIPSSLTTPYWLRVLYGEWLPASGTTAVCFDKISTRVVNCAGDGVTIKYFDIPVTSHPNGKTIALKMSGFLPDGTFYGETYYCGLYGE